MHTARSNSPHGWTLSIRVAKEKNKCKIKIKPHSMRAKRWDRIHSCWLAWLWLECMRPRVGGLFSNAHRTFIPFLVNNFQSYKLFLSPHTQPVRCCRRLVKRRPDIKTPIRLCTLRTTFDRKWMWKLQSNSGSSERFTRSVHHCHPERVRWGCEGTQTFHEHVHIDNNFKFSLHSLML